MTPASFPWRREPDRNAQAPCIARGLRGNGGFTLIEILVVVAIVGIVVTVAAVNLFPSPLEHARRQAGNVALALEHARDAAWFGGRPTSITIAEGRLQEWRLAGNAWERTAEPERRLGPDLEVTGLFLDGHALESRERLVFLADGLGIPFRVNLKVGGGAWAIEGDAAGAVHVLEPR